MDKLSLEEIKKLTWKCGSISDQRRHELIKILDGCDSYVEVPDEVLDELMEAFSREAKKAAEEVARIKKEIAARKTEKADLEAQQLPYIKEATLLALEEMDKVAAQYERDLSEVETEVTKKIEGHKSNADQSEADAIRKKLGIA